MSSTWQDRISVSIFGESHGDAIGCTLDGIPAGEEIDFAVLNAFLQRRAPGRFPWATPRKEADAPEFLSGIARRTSAAHKAAPAFGESLSHGFTTGAPISAIIRNTNTRSHDYDETRFVPRPGHADFTAYVKYGGHADMRGGGHFSGRLTAPLCIAGGICLQILARRGIFIGAHIASIGNILSRQFNHANVTADEINSLHGMDFPAWESQGEMIAEIERARQNGDSVGGTIECAAIGLPAGIGSPMFDGMENRISQLVFAIPAIKGIEFGSGFGSLCGSETNDAFIIRDGKIETATNNHGGILGGITTGMPLIFRVAVKPTPSISHEQQSVNLATMEPATIAVKGRHDPCIVPRAVPCIEAAAAIAICNEILGKIPR